MKQYTKKQILDSIKHWKKVLESMDESAAERGKYLYVTKNNPSFKGMVRKAGASGVKKLEDPHQYEVLSQKLNRYSTCVPVKWEAAYQVNIPAGSDLKQLENDLFSSIINANGVRYNEPGASGNELFSIDDIDMQNAIDEFIESHPGCELIEM